MLTLKKGYPEESEILLCTVTKIHYHSVFVVLDEYENKQGMIHISEISPGRIRNLSDYVQEGKKIVCKVLKINKDRGHIDLSLRRVSQAQRRAKIDEIKQNQKAEKIVEYVAKQFDMSTETLYDKIYSQIIEKYHTLHDAFQAYVEEEYSLDDLDLDKKVKAALEDIIKQRIKPLKVEITGKMSLLSYESEGVEIIKECLENILSKYDDLKISYLGGGKYSFKIISGDFKTAEKILKDATEDMEKFMHNHNSKFSFTKEEGKKAKA
ncbi:MAG: translation initiation factor IF-2 subunit alpha [Candidatus Woesearchaeota archaeon]